jgi:hypothetical protein
MDFFRKYSQIEIGQAKIKPFILFSRGLCGSCAKLEGYYSRRQREAAREKSRRYISILNFVRLEKKQREFETQVLALDIL